MMQSLSRSVALSFMWPATKWHSVTNKDKHLFNMCKHLLNIFFHKKMKAEYS